MSDADLAKRIYGAWLQDERCLTMELPHFLAEIAALASAAPRAAPQGGSGWIPGDRVLVERALRPFIHRDLSRIASGNIEGGASPVFQRDDAVLTLGDFWRAQAAYNQLFPAPQQAADHEGG